MNEVKIYVFHMRTPVGVFLSILINLHVCSDRIYYEYYYDGVGFVRTCFNICHEFKNLFSKLTDLTKKPV